MATDTADHFDRDLFQFLADLAANNERDWFKANSDRYETWVREPAFAFIRDMAPRIAGLSSHFMAKDKKVGGSLMRVHRDVRFGKDKRPYKTNVGIHFRHEQAKDVHAPGLYLHLAVEECFIGAGMWMPDSASLAAIRAKIDEEQDRWAGIIGAESFTSLMRQGGESLKRGPRGYPKDHPMLDELKRKSFIAVADLQGDDVTRPGFAGRLIERYAAAGPYVQFLCEAVGVPY